MKIPKHCPQCGSNLVQPRLTADGWDCLNCGARSAGVAGEAITKRKDGHRQLTPVALAPRRS